MEEQLFEFIKSVVYNVTGKKGLLYDTDFVKDLALNSFDIMNNLYRHGMHNRHHTLPDNKRFRFLLCNR